MFIFEGPDGAGKSVLAKMLARKSEYTYLHGTHTDPSDLKWYLYTIQSGTVTDRTFISEIIYSKVLNRKCRVNEKEIRIIERMIQNAIIFYVTAPIEIILERAFNRGESFLTREQLVQVHAEYENYFKSKYGKFNIIKVEPYLLDLNII